MWGKERLKTKKKASRKRKTSQAGSKNVQVTVSIGVSDSDKTGATPESVIKNADKALYKAKKSGRNCVKSL